MKIIPENPIASNASPTVTISTAPSGNQPSSSPGVASAPSSAGSAPKGDEPSSKVPPKEKEITYDYLDSGGKLLFQILRRPGKKFSARRPSEEGGWIRGIKRGIYFQRGSDWIFEKEPDPDLPLGELGPGRRIFEACPLVPYHLPDVLKAEEVFVVEGEKDADNLAALGFATTTNPFGAGKWGEEFSPHFKGKAAVILPDNDDKGRKHAEAVATSLAKVTTSLKLLELPRLPEKGDVSDWIAEQRDVGEAARLLREMVHNTPARALSPSSPADAGDATDDPPPQLDEADLALREKYGEPYYFNRNGDVSKLNERYWAGLYHGENRILWEPQEQGFYRYEEKSGLWTAATVEGIIDRLATRMLSESRRLHEPGLERKSDQSGFGAIVGALKGIAEKPDAFKREGPKIIHVANGVIRMMDDGEVLLGDFSPEFYSRNQCPIEFRPDAECPRFLNELLYSALKPSDVDLLQRVIGVILYGRNLPQRIVILDGTPGGGKSTLIRVITGLIGPSNCYQLRTRHLDEKFEVYRYRAKSLLYGPDVAGNFLMHESAGVLKSLVGGDPMSAEGKNSNGDFPISGNFNVLISCNTRLRVRFDGDLGAWRRRLLIIRYENPPPAKRILDFDRILLREEGPGILRWALQGFIKAKEEFEKFGDYALTDTAKERTDTLLEESNSVALFLQDRITKDPKGDVTVSELTEAYAAYCADRGWNPMPITVFERQLPGLVLELFGIAKSNSVPRREKKSNRGFRNIRLMEVVEDENALGY